MLFVYILTFLLKESCSDKSFYASYAGLCSCNLLYIKPLRAFTFFFILYGKNLWTFRLSVAIVDKYHKCINHNIFDAAMVKHCIPAISNRGSQCTNFQ